VPNTSQGHLRKLPSVGILAMEACVLDKALSERLCVMVARQEIEQIRDAIDFGQEIPDFDQIVSSVAMKARLMSRPSPRRVINATGVILHTNLGRAPLAESALKAAYNVSAGYSDLEFDLDAGSRGARSDHLKEIIRDLTGAEGVFVVNNNAGAILLVLCALANGGEVLVSRGEAVEIGGSFRVPDILMRSGAILKDVGTTNRTRITDYSSAVNEKTSLILKVHSSNFRIVGFTITPTLKDIASVASKSDVPLVNDLGSGSLLDSRKYGLRYEPMVQDSVKAGSSITTFSGDKLLGGPQAGLIVGDANLIDQIASNPLARALRPDKMTLAALHATLMHYLDGDASNMIPVWRMISMEASEVESRAESLVACLPRGIKGAVVAGNSTVGGGALPGDTIVTSLVRLEHQYESSMDLVKRLRSFDPPVIGRIEDDSVILDPRTVLDNQMPHLRDGLATL